MARSGSSCRWRCPPARLASRSGSGSAAAAPANATGVPQRHPPQEWIAAAVMVVVLALIALDILDDSFNTWFDQHSFTTDAVSTLLGLAVAALVVDRISDRRRLRDR